MHILYGLGNPLRKNMQYVCISTITFILLHKHVCLQGESVLSISFPALGTPDFTDPPTKANPEDVDAAGSMFWPLQAVYLGHPRLPCIPSANRKYHSCVQIQESVEEHSRQKRLEGGNQCAHFQGQEHQESLYCKSLMNEKKEICRSFQEDLSAYGSPDDASQAKPDHIYMDHMGFGMGCCCLQVGIPLRTSRRHIPPVAGDVPGSECGRGEMAVRSAHPHHSHSPRSVCLDSHLPCKVGRRRLSLGHYQCCKLLNNSLNHSLTISTMWNWCVNCRVWMTALQRRGDSSH